jgi:hypothetical protein
VDLDMVFNDLSVYPPAENRRTAQQWMSGLLDTVRLAVKSGLNRALRTDENFFAIVLAPNYPLAAWRGDNNVDKEERRYFRSIATKAPFLYDLPEVEDGMLLFEYKFEGIQAKGLGVAIQIDALALSFRSAQAWERPYLEVQTTQVEQDGSLSETNDEVVHASSVEHVFEHQAWIENRVKRSIQDGSDLWDRRHQLLSTLVFCESVESQMKDRDLRGGDPLLQFVVRALFGLDDFCKKWTVGPFDPTSLGHGASPESEPTLQQFGAQRTFTCPDGEQRLFKWHVKIGYKAWRIHFFPDDNTRTIIVGYLGRHLPTVKDPT